MPMLPEPNRLLAFATLLITVLLCACSRSPGTAAPVITVYKSPSCECCLQWVTHLEENGFVVKIESQEELRSVRARLGVPDRLAACHTGVVNGYVVEGHVPAEDIKRLLVEKPAAKGIAVPGMPLGSPGMEQGGRRDPYLVLLFQSDGRTSVFAQHGGFQ